MTNAAPDHVRLASEDLRSVLKRRPPIGRERDLPDAGRSLHTMDTSRRRERRGRLLQGGNEQREHRQKRTLQLTRSSTKLAVEAGKPVECRHA
jgi:hypothetical protein